MADSDSGILLCHLHINSTTSTLRRLRSLRLFPQLYPNMTGFDPSQLPRNGVAAALALQGRQFGTLAVHAGAPHDPHTGAVIAPVCAALLYMDFQY